MLFILNVVDISGSGLEGRKNDTMLLRKVKRWSYVNEW